MRVLLLADACNPEMASTAYFAYQICQALARQLDEVVVATQVRNRDAFGRHAIDGCRVEFIDSESVARPMYRLSRWLRRDAQKALTLNVALAYPSYLAFERGVWKRFRGELRQGAFDVVHRVTPLSPNLPSPMASWSPVPFVIGPVNGGLRWPRQFLGELAREREWLSFARGAARWMPYYRSTYRRAAAILAGFQHTRDALPAAAGPRIFDCPDVGFDANGVAPPSRPPRDRMTALFVGRLVPYKCPDVAVEAFAASPALRRHRLLLIGDGPERARIEAIVARHGLESCVELLGWVDHETVIRHMREADVFAFPSVRELGAGVVVEAMGEAMACVVVDYGGPGGYIDETRGIQVPLVDKDDMVGRFTAARESLADDPARRAALGRAAYEYVSTRHSWDAKAARIREVYEWTLGRWTGPRPDFFEASRPAAGQG
jgi:glycosyltransferase involved in cell wall biosynthesis